jgi:hypothetical protein
MGKDGFDRDSGGFWTGIFSSARAVAQPFPVPGVQVPWEGLIWALGKGGFMQNTPTDSMEEEDCARRGFVTVGSTNKSPALGEP